MNQQAITITQEMIEIVAKSEYERATGRPWDKGNQLFRGSWRAKARLMLKTTLSAAGVPFMEDPTVFRRQAPAFPTEPGPYLVTWQYAAHPEMNQFTGWLVLTARSSTLSGPDGVITRSEIERGTVTLISVQKGAVKR